jgi:undecaprenyl-phosphate galactose phosphotransferase
MGTEPFSQAMGTTAELAVKRALDVVLAAVLLVLLAPLLLFVAAWVRLDGSPVIYRQTRIGRDGRRFRCLKFRTMAVNAPIAGDAPEWALASQDDPRLTAAGRFLRRTSVDELPQLLNVLRGDMSLVGPRPIAASDEPLFGDQIAAYRAMKPGITGLWQISGRSKLSYSERVQLDEWYAKHWSILKDLSILLKTIPAIRHPELDLGGILQRISNHGTRRGTT